MSEQGKTPKSTGVKFTPENYNYLNGKGGSISAAVNDIIESVRTGKIEVAGHPQGDASTVCIFDLPELKEGVCPVRKKNEFLQKPIHHDALIRTCGKCPLLKLHIELEKAKNKAQRQYPNAFNKPQEPTYTPPEEEGKPSPIQPQKPQLPPVIIKCESCGLSLRLENFREFGTPLLALRNEMLRHVKAMHGRDHLTPPEWPVNLVERLKGMKKTV